MCMDLVLIRHLKPFLVAGICYGATDVPASLDIADLRLPEELPVASTIWTSPLSRCLNLAKKLQFTFGLELVVDERLTELDFGVWEMQEWDAIGAALIDDWIASGYSNLHQGESLMQFDSRILDWYTDLDRTMNHVVVTHAGVIRSIHRQFLGLTLNQSLSLPVPFGSGLKITLF